MIRKLRGRLLVSAPAGWYRNLPLSRKIVLLVCVAGLLPVGLVLVLSLTQMQKNQEQQLLYALNQGYTQVSQAVEDRLDQARNVSTMLAVNEQINESLAQRNQEKSVTQQLADFGEISSYIYSVEMAFDAGRILFYIDESFPVVQSYNGRYRNIETIRDLEWYKNLEKNNGRLTWVGYKEGIYETDHSYLAAARNLWDQDDYSKAIGVLTVLLERKSVEELLIGSAREQVMYLETPTGELLAANVPTEELVRLPLDKRTVKDKAFHRVQLDGRAYFVRSQLIDKNNIYLVSLIPQSVMDKQILEVNIRMWLLYLLLCAAILAIMLPMLRSVTGRMQLLKNQMQLVRQGTIHKINTEPFYQDEIGELIVNYNEMADDVERLLKEQYILGQEKTGAQLKALQSQINPHFLYNTLDMINWMAQRNETDNVRSVVQAMSRFYRLTLSKGQDIVTIADEVMMCEAYMEIQKRRYKGRLNYEVEVEDDIMDCLIPKITLQPFLENAIIHGINEKEDARGIVALNGWMEDGRITLSVTDDGVGMESIPDKPSSGSQYGMKNIEERLKLFYGETIQIQIESSLGIGTCIILSIPVRRKEEDGK